MDVREKLVELLQDENNPVWRWFPNNATMAQLADYLINSGVTVQELDGCEYCKEDREGFIRMFGAFSITNPFHGNEWFINTGHCKPRQIFFCPMCGRKLPQPPKGEQP